MINIYSLLFKDTFKLVKCFPVFPYALCKEQGLSLHSAAFNQVPPRRAGVQCWGVSNDTLKDCSSLQQMHLPLPTITAPKEVLVKVHAASVNPLDVAMIGGYGANMMSLMRRVDEVAGSAANICNEQQLPCLVGGRDFCGEVVGCGVGVTNVSVGERVMGVVSPHKQGSHATHVITHQDNLVPAPPLLSDSQCAGVPYAFLTAYSAAVVTGASCRVETLKGKRALVAGAAGGVGLMLVQLLAAYGAQVASVCREDAFDLLSSLGVLELYDYRDPAALDQLKLEHSFDLVFDASSVTDLFYLSAVAPGGSYVTLTSPLLRHTDQRGLLFGAARSALDLLCQNSGEESRGRLVKWAYFSPSNAALKEARRMMMEGKLVCVVDRAYPFSETPAAYEHMTHGPHAGKTIIQLTHTTK